MRSFSSIPSSRQIVIPKGGKEKDKKSKVAKFIYELFKTCSGRLSTKYLRTDNDNH